VPQATTGNAIEIGNTIATLIGTVNPDGQQSTYSFEIGVADGAGIGYGLLVTELAGSGVIPVPEAYIVTGLEPDTEYFYRITVKSGFGQAIGAPSAFVTTPLPLVLPIPQLPPQLTIPDGLHFPRKVVSSCKHRYVRDKHGRCVRPKHVRKIVNKGTKEKGMTKTRG
jgi:hypothetical protein